MGYADGPSGSNKANSWLDQIFGGWAKPINFKPPSNEAMGAVRGPTDARSQMSDLYEKGLGPVGTTRQTNPMGLSGRPAMPQSEPSNSMKLIQSLGANKLQGLSRTPGDTGTGTRQGNDDIPQSRYRDGPSEEEQQMEKLQALLDRDFQPSGEYNSMVDEAYASALANIGKARGQANSNFHESDGRIADLTASHVNEINTRDRAAVEKNGSDLQSSYKDTYGAARGQIQGDQAAEMAAKTEMLNRLGQQEAGVGDAGQGESEALTQLTKREAGAMQQAQGYQAADLTRNTEQAQSQASAGVERRSALNRDLQKILGNIDDSEATVNQAKSVAKMQGAQNEKADFRQEQQFNLDSMKQLQDGIQGKADKTWERSFKERELAAKSSGKGSSGGVYDAVGQDLSSRGIDPAPYLDAYNEVMSTGNFNPSVHGDKNAFYASKMKEVLKKKGLNADSAAVGRVVMGINNYGTDKLGN